VHLRTNWLYLGMVILATLAFMSAAMVTKNGYLWGVAASAPLCGSMLLTSPAGSRIRTKRVKGTLEVTDAGVALSGRTILRRADIVSGLVTLRIDGPPLVRLERRAGRDVELEVPTEEEGHKLLHALGLEASQAVTRFTTSSKLFASRFAGAATAVVAVNAYVFGIASGAYAAAVGIPLLMLFAFVAAKMALRVRVSIGADGLRIVGRPNAEEFISYGDIESVELGATALAVQLKRVERSTCTCRRSAARETD
jgi:hypothetical protein